MMNSCERFRETMRFGRPDRVPLFEEGIRSQVLKSWKNQGMSENTDLEALFSFDHRHEIRIDLEPHPGFKTWPNSLSELKAERRRFDSSDTSRLPENLRADIETQRQDDHLIMMRVHEGFFQSMGVGDWRRFAQVIYLLADNPELVRQIMLMQGELAAELTERVLQEVVIDAAIIAEPIAGHSGVLISPRMYEKFVLSSYEPILKVLHRHNIETVILRTYGNFRALIPSILKWDINCLWINEANKTDMDYRQLRREFGRDLRLIGGIDLNALRLDREAIRREIEDKVPTLLAQGGYIPLADGRVRKDVRFENYRYYRELLEKITSH